MTREIIVFSILASALFLAYIIYLSQQRKLSEQYAVFWVVAGLAMLGTAVNPGLLEVLASWLAVDYPPALLFLLAFLLSLGLILHLSTVISRQQKQIRDLAQALALLEHQRNPAADEGEQLRD